jgi:ligand-binding sensor domain-containing protein
MYTALLIAKLKIRNLRRLVLILSIVFAGISLYSQDNKKIKFQRISSENFKLEKGLSQNSVKCILQDKDGFMWYGTWDGLNRYDGFSFIIYKSDVFNKENVLSNQTVNALYEDSFGYLWIGTETGLNRFDKKPQKFIQFRHLENDKFSISGDTIISIAEDDNGIMWVGTNFGLNKFNRNDNTFERFRFNPDNANSLSNNVINKILPDKNGNLWLGTEKGISVLNIKTKVFGHYYHNPESNTTISSDIVFSLLFDKKGNLWIGTDNGLDYLDKQTKKIFHYKFDANDPYSLSNNSVSALFEDSFGLFWVGTNGGGVNLFDKNNKRFLHFRNNTFDNTSVSDDYINVIYEDRSGILWIGTSWKGVNVFDRYSNKFEHYVHITDDHNSLNNNIVWAVNECKDGLLYIATDEGINILNRNTNMFSFMKSEHGKTNTMISNLVRVIFEDSKENLWIGTLDKGLDKYNRKTKKFTHYTYDKNDPDGISHNRIWGILEDKNGYIWVATGDGLNRYDPDTEKFKKYRNEPGNIYSLSNNQVTSIYFDRSDVLWVCTYKGLNYLDQKTGRFYRFENIPGDNQSISCNAVFSICQDKSGIYWIATMGGGLNRFDLKRNEFKHFLEKDGLSNNVVYNILDDGTGNLWISTNYGLSKFNIKNSSFINYDVKDGIQSNEFNLGAVFHNKKTNEMFFGGMNGFNSFYPLDIKVNKYVPNIVISSFKIFDIVQNRGLKDGDTINLTYSDNFFSFEFSALDFSNPSKTKYSYILENYDKEWNYCDAYKRFAGYTKVPPGYYIFKVKGASSEGIWNENGISVIIIIKPPWWGTWWFRVAFTLIIFSVIWYIIYLRIRNIRIKHEDEKKLLKIEKQMFELEQTALRLQMNPHFIFNSLNSIQSFVISSDTDKAINYLAKFSQLMRLILAHSQKSFVPLNDELKALSFYLEIEQLRFDNKFDFNIYVDNRIDQEFIDVPPMIIQPYVENAIIHGILHKTGKGLIKINMKLLNETTILCTVEDDGIGREKAIQIKKQSDLRHKSRGMLITQKRLEILNKQNKDQISIRIIDLKDEAGVPTGTKVEIYLMYKEV